MTTGTRSPRAFASLLGAALLAVAWATPAISQTAATDPTYRIYVTNERSGDMTIIDGESFEPIATEPLGKRPRGIRLGPDGQTLFVALSGSPIAGPGVDESTLPPADKSADGIGLFDIAAGEVTRVIEGVSDPEQLDIDADGRLYITSEDTGMLVIVNIASGETLASLPVGTEPEGISLTPDERFAYVTSEADNQVSIIDTNSQEVVARLPVGDRPRNTAFSPDGSRAYVPGEFDSSVTVIDTEQHKVLKTAKIGDDTLLPMDAALSPDGTTLYITTGRGGTLIAVDAETLDVKQSVAVGERPWGLALSPDGRYVFTANGPSNDISVVDTTTMSVVETVQAGNSPWGVAVVPTGE